MRLRILDPAYADTREIFRYYERIRQGLGSRFLRAFGRAVEEILETPQAFTRIDRGHRQRKLRKYPHAVIYRLEDESVVVVAVAHLSANADIGDGVDRASNDSSNNSALILGGGLAGIAAAVKLSAAGVPVTLVETRKRLGGRATSFVDPTTKEVLDNCQHVLLGCCTNLIDLYERLGVAEQIEWHRKLYFAGPLPPSPFLGRGRGEGLLSLLSPRERMSRYSVTGEGLSSSFSSSAASTSQARAEQTLTRPLPGGEGVEIHIDSLEADDLPAPLHMTRALLGFRTLSWPEKIAISRGMLAMMRLGVEGREKLNDRTFAAWLREQKQPAGAITKFWAVVVISAINELPERMGAGYAIQVFQEAFLANEKAYVMGLSAVPLVDLYDAAEKVITQSGGRLLLGRSVERLNFDSASGGSGSGGRVTGAVLDGGETITASEVVSALPFDRLAKICPPEMLDADARLRPLMQFEVSPIIGIHLRFECADGAPLMELPHVIVMEGPLQWIFNKGWERDGGATTGRGQHLHGVISAAHDLVDETADRIIELTLAELYKVLPRARGARLLHARVVKEKRATFSATPGIEAIRPTAAGAISNLYLAGDWCRTGWPATMEGATRSGYLAANALLERAGAGGAAEPLVADLEATTLYRLISR